MEASAVYAVQSRRRDRLIRAIYEQDVLSLRLVLDDGLEPSVVMDSNRNTGLHTAARKGWIEGMELLLSYGANPLATNEYGFSPLHDAASTGERRPVEILIANGADLVARSQSDYTPVMVAATASRGGALRALLGAGEACRVDGLDRPGSEPVAIAARLGRDDCLLAFIEADPVFLDVLQADDFWGHVRQHLSVMLTDIEQEEHIGRLRRLVASCALSSRIESAMSESVTSSIPRSSSLGVL